MRLEVANFSRRPRHRPGLRVVLRVLKIVEPPKPEDAEVANQVFREGELAQEYNLQKGAVIGPWAKGPRWYKPIITPSSLQLLKDTYLTDEVL